MLILKRLLITVLTVTTLSSPQIHAMELDKKTSEPKEFEMEALCQKFATMMNNSIDPMKILNEIKTLLDKKCEKAAENFVLELQLYLLEQDQTLADVKNHEGSTLLHLACKNGWAHVVKAILNGVSEDRNELLALLKQMSQEGEAQAPVLHWAAYHGQVDCAREIFTATGEDTFEVFKIYASNGANPLHIAIQAGHLEIVKLFLDTAGNDAWDWLCLEGSCGGNALDYAIGNNNRDIIIWIIEFVGNRAEELITRENSKGKCALDKVFFHSTPLIWTYLNGIHMLHNLPDLLSCCQAEQEYDLII